MAQLGGAGEALAGPAHVLAGDQQAVVALGRYQGLQLLRRQGKALEGAGGGRDGPAAELRIDLAHQPGGTHAAPPHHHPIGARLLQAAPGSGRTIDIAISDHRDRQRRLHRSDGGPVGLTLEALFAAAAVQGEQLGTGIFEPLAPAHRIAAIAPAQPRFHRHRERYGRGHACHQAGRQLGIADQATAAAFLGDLLHRAAHIDVDQKGAGGLGPLGRLGHGGGPVIK